MGKNPLMPTTERGKATRRRILRAAEQCFSEYGYAATSVAEIVRRSGVSQGSFYVYFKSKQAVFEELIRQLLQDIRQVTRAAIAEAGSRLEAEIAGTLAFLHWMRDHRDLHRVLHLIDEVDPALAQEFYSGIASGYTEGLAEAIQTGEVQRVNPEVLAYALMGMNHFISMRWSLWEEDGDVPAEVVEDFRRIIAGALRGVPDIEST